MLDNGYALARIEILNWGNFHGYQKFDLRPDRDDGLLFAPPSGSAILGVNGSGKSTLIDALMITLLPFEGSVKLGVTNDVESGSAGGRTIRDYVLGKHSSTTGRDGGTLAGSMGRKEGCSMVLLVFRHNRAKDKIISIGRVWWYQNYAVSDTQLAFLTYDSIQVADLCPDGKTPRNPKAFRQHCKETMPQLQVFETMQAYFSSLSSSFGKISRDDLKILNRAFYVKSISQIDQFIRENMLLEQDNPHLDRLLENVRNGQEIALAIETCESKIASIGRILKDLRKLEEIAERKLKLDREERLLSVHREWADLRRTRVELKKLKEEIAHCEASLPQIARAVQEAQRHHASIQSQIIHNDLDARLQRLGLEIEFLSERIKTQEAELDAAEKAARSLDLKLPKRPDGWLSFSAEIDDRIQESAKKTSDLHRDIDKKREEKFALDLASKEIREELQHLSEFKTLIPKDLYWIKEEALKDLKIPRGYLCFVGELIQVPRDHHEYRRAIESVLFPVSRNLLCHPNHLQEFTQWLDGKGLRADLVAKRITQEELESEDGDWEGSAKHLLKDSRSFKSPRGGPKEADTRISARGRLYSPHQEENAGERFVLDMIEILPRGQHPFSRYLWQWLRAKFDYRVGSLKEFRSSENELVTIEGLVKSDRRTMRKLKRNFQFSLGWDNSERMAELTEELTVLNARHSGAVESLEALSVTVRLEGDRGRFLEGLRAKCAEFSALGAGQKKLEDLVRERTGLLDSDPDYQKLKELEAEIAQKIKDLQKRESGLESETEFKRKKVNSIEILLPEKEKELQESLLYSRLREDLGGESGLVEELERLESKLEHKKVSRLQYESELKAEIQALEASSERARSAASANLNGFKRDFNDPNLPYNVPESATMAAFVCEWTAAEERLHRTELPQAQEKWRRFFDQVLMDSVKDTINEIKSKIHEIERSIQSINEVLKLTNFEDLPEDKRYLKIHVQSSSDDRIRRFRKSIAEIEKILGSGIRSNVESQSQNVMGVLVPFVDEFQKEVAYRTFVTDVRNHFQFEVHSLRRMVDAQDELAEVFTGARRDAKSSAQTTQLAYALLASCLAYRFKFHDPVGGQETPRILILDEFGGKFDNEKPREILKLLDKMGFQSILVSPMSKADLLAEGISHLVFVHKVSATQSKVQSFEVTSKSEYDRLVRQMAGIVP